MSETALSEVADNTAAKIQTGARLARRSPGRELRKSHRTCPDPQPPWQSIAVRHLTALAAVARARSFCRAAEELGYVQSAISSQIAYLEQVVGMRLVERSSGTPVVELTDAGQLFLRHVEEILARFEIAHTDVSSAATGATGPLRVAGLEQLAPREIAKIMSLFREGHPFARVMIHDAEAGPAQLRDGTLDLLVYEPPAVQASLTQVVLHKDRYVLLVSADSELAGRSEPLSSAELAALRPIVPSSVARSGRLAGQLTTLGLDPHPLVTPQSVSTAQALVADGLGTALVPHRLVDFGNSATVAVELSHVLADRTIVLGFASEPDRSGPVTGFVRAARLVCGDAPDDLAARLAHGSS